MKTILLALFSTSLLFAADKPTDSKVKAPLEHKVKSLDGKDVDLSTYKGKVVLFVNVASKCGNTPQYTGLQSLYEKYSKDGFVIIGVPANDFGKQEPGTAEEIQKFCSSKYSVTFPLLEKQSVKGADKSPLYVSLTSKEIHPKSTGEITWNFEKILVNRKGEVVARFKPGLKPEDKDFVKAIETELGAK